MSSRANFELVLVAGVACGTFRPATSVTMVASATLPIDARVAIVELGDAVYAFDRSTVSIVRGGKVVGSTESEASWTAAATIVSPDGQGRWVVGIAGDALWRVTPTGGLEAVNERLGVNNAKVLAVDGVGRTSVIGLSAGAIVSKDGSHVMEFSGLDAPVVAAARDRVAIAGANEIAVFDLAANSKISYHLEHATQIGFLDATTAHPRLVAVGDGVLYEADGAKLVKVPIPATRAIAISGSRLWFTTCDGIYTRGRDGLIVALRGPPHEPTIFGSRTGDLWLRASNHVARYAVEPPREDPAWHRTVEPIFERACAGCHLSGGDADLDLSTPTAWAFRRSEIIDRVLVARTMPPDAASLSDAERDLLSTWLRSTP